MGIGGIRAWSVSLGRPLVMGVLNVTPDSFSDGGQFVTVEEAVARAETMMAEGADIIDIGPESSRPGAGDVTADEQIRRAIPVIEGILAVAPGCVVSIDTRLAAVAQRALAAGAVLVNDISAGTGDARMAETVARYDAAWVLMHMQGTPQTMQINPVYDDVVRQVRAYLVERAQAAVAAGIDPQRVVIDPGIGFGKSVAHNVALLAGLESLVRTGWAVLIGASRKRFLSSLSDDATGADQRLGGSLACVGRAVSAGVQIVRVHDVGATRGFIDTIQALR